MPAYKDKARGTWYASFYYTDWDGQRRKKLKRGFARQKDAREFEAEFLRKSAGACDMTFASLLELYLDDMRGRLKATTMVTKESILRHSVLPYFAETKVNEITPAQVRQWQTKLLAGGISATYARNIHAQLSSVLNYAVKFYHLQNNPARLAGSMGADHAEEMHFWTVDQFNAVLPFVRKVQARVGMQVLFWTGMRVGELLALTPDDVDLTRLTVTICKNYQRVHGEEIVSTPKTPTSRRVVPIPESLAQTLREYMAAMYKPAGDERIFPVNRDFYENALASACRRAGVEPIRVHDLRHSHAALLISLGTPILLVSQRLGHRNVQTTLQIYGHLYPNTEPETIAKLENLMK